MEKDIQQALEILRKGGVIVYPTDTIWGIGCDATLPDAVSKIYRIKQRDDSKSMIVLVNEPNMVARFVDRAPQLAWDLIEYATKPLTIIYDGARGLAPNLYAADGSLGIRVCSDAFCKELIRRFRKPIVSTSANISGEPAPRFFDEVSADIISAADYVVEYRQEDRTPAVPSSIIRLKENGEIKIIR
jgi:L-threonylcarbamoyladenylate synthase